MDVNNGDYFEPSRITLKSWVELWLKEYTGDKKYLTVKHYKAQCNSHIIPSLGAVKLSALTVPQIQAFYNRLLRDGLAPKSVCNIHGILTKCLSTAANVGYLRTNPASQVTLPKVEKKEIHPLTDEQVKQFLQIAGEDEYEILLKVILFTGLRESEAIDLTWDCVDFRKGTLKICKQLQKRPKQDGGFTFAPLKNDKTRILKPAPSVMALLERRWKEQAAQRLRIGDLWEGWQNEEERKTALVFTTMSPPHLCHAVPPEWRRCEDRPKRIGPCDGVVHLGRLRSCIPADAGGQRCTDGGLHSERFLPVRENIRETNLPLFLIENKITAQNAKKKPLRSNFSLLSGFYLAAGEGFEEPDRTSHA